MTCHMACHMHTLYMWLLRVLSHDTSHAHWHVYDLVHISLSARSGSTQRSSIVMVGFSDGYVRGYSKSGQRVFSRLMHHEPVSKLTCMASSAVQKPAPSLVSCIHCYVDVVMLDELYLCMLLS